MITKLKMYTDIFVGRSKILEKDTIEKKLESVKDDPDKHFYLQACKCIMFQESNKTLAILILSVQVNVVRCGHQRAL